MRKITPFRYIREVVFGVETQEEFGKLLGYTQANISRFENGHPVSSKAQEKVRKLASDKAIIWDNNWFFEVPTSNHIEQLQLNSN